MSVKGFIRLHSCSSCQWGPQCLTVLVVAPKSNKGLSSATLYENMTNCSLTCETQAYHRYMYKKCVWKVSYGCIHVQAANGGRSVLQYLLLHQINDEGLSYATLYKNMTKYSPTCETRKNHRYMYKECVWMVSYGCIHVQAANGCRSVLQYFLLHQINDKGLSFATQYENITKCSPTCESRKYHRLLYTEWVLKVS